MVFIVHGWDSIWIWMMNNRWSMKIVLSLWHLEEKPGRAAWRCPLHIQQQSCHLWCWNTKLKILEGNVAFCCRSLLLTILNFLDASSKSFNSQYFPCFSKALIHQHWKLKKRRFLSVSTLSMFSPPHSPPMRLWRQNLRDVLLLINWIRGISSPSLTDI